jgi:histone H3/H4
MSSAADTAEVTAAVSTDASPGAASKENQPKDSNAATPAASSATGSMNAPSSTTGTKGTPAAQPSAVEFEPPAACIRRILKNTLHAHTNVGKDSVTAFARATGIFIIYLTACANDFARENRRQTITANDVLAAIKVSEDQLIDFVVVVFGVVLFVLEF